MLWYDGFLKKKQIPLSKSQNDSVLISMALCRLTVQAYKLGIKIDGYDDEDLLNGIAYAEDLLELGFSKEPHDDYDLQRYIDWAMEAMEEGQMQNNFRCTCCDKSIPGKGLCSECVKKIRKEIEEREVEAHPGG